MQSHDPGGAALRRGVQLAIALPLVAFLVSRVALDPEGVVYGALLTTAILAMADFSGPWQVRVFGPIATAAFAAVAVVVGILASVNLITVIITTLIVGATLAFIPTLRGLPAAGAPSVLLMYAIAVTTDIALSDLPKVVLGLAIGLAVTVVVLLVVFPGDNRSQIRLDIATAMRAQADYIAARWLGQGDETVTYQRYERDVNALTRNWIGKPYRPAGTAESDHALILLASRLRVVFTLLPGLAVPNSDEVATATATRAVALIRANADALDGLGPPPPLADISADRQRTRESVIARIQQQTDGDEAVGLCVRAHGPQVLLAFASDASIMVRNVLGDRRKSDSSAVQTPAHWWTDLTANASFRSPWGRHALRTGIALAIAASIVSVADLNHGYWVLLGVISVLRIDAAATGSQAFRAILGTLIGVAAGFGTLLIIDPYPVAVWILAPIAAFVAGWSSRAVGFAFGQGAFSFFVLVLFSAVSWPPQYETALDRLLDIGVGVGVAAIVGILMWPSGMVTQLRASLADALDTGTAALRREVNLALGRTSAQTLRDHWPVDRAVIRRATETFDLCVVQRRDVDAVQGHWAQVAGDIHVLIFSGLRVGLLFEVAATPIPAHERIVDEQLLITATYWHALAERTRSPKARAPIMITDDEPGVATFHRLGQAVQSSDLADSATAASLATAVWAIDWLVLLERVAQLSLPPTVAPRAYTR